MTGPVQTRDVSDSVVRLEDVRKVYLMGSVEVEALAGVSLHFARGSFTAIMGPSGSGKSTLLNLLGCLDRPSAGRYFLDGENVADLEDEALSDRRLHRLGFVFQSFHLIPQLTVEENIELPMFYARVPSGECRRRSAELAEMVGLSDRRRHRPMELSGGQRQRAAIARALANDPPVILADEPTGNLDSRTGEQIMGLLDSLNRSGRTIIMVTHERDIAERARTVITCRDGRISTVEHR